MRLTVAIVGRPNVGKSTLFNRLAGRRLAIVEDTPGVTRDWRSTDCRIGGICFTAIDTAGLEDITHDSLESRMRQQTEQAIRRADVILFLIDARAGITPTDRHFADWLRQSDIPVILVANKAEGNKGLAGAYEAYELGLGDPVPVSAEHGEGLADLVEALLPFTEDEAEPDEAEDTEARADHAEGAGREPPLRIAIVGRPNVGKSTLLNALIGEERVLAGPEAGMTRDAISVDWVWRDRPFRLVDTAGMRRRARVETPLERLAVADTLRTIRLAQVVILVVDAAEMLDRQDLIIARLVVDEGRALVLAVNKWDQVEDRAAAVRQLKDRLEASLAQARGVSWVTLSALRAEGLDRLLDAVTGAFAVWNKRISTSPLNRWLADMVERHPPPLVEGRRIKIRYMTQVKARPPAFALFVNKPMALPEAYQRFLIQGLREAFKLPGTPIRILLRKGENPYQLKDRP